MSRSAWALPALASVAFIGLGLPDGLLGVAWPSIRDGFELPLDALGALLISFTAGYVVSSFSGGYLVRGMGLGALLAASCLATAASLFGYTAAPAWWVMVALASVAGAGAGGIDTGINTYAATHHGPRMLNWLHACYGVGAASGPAIMIAVFAAQLPWQRGYQLVAAAQVALGLAFLATLHAWPAATRDGKTGARVGPPVSILETLGLPVARWSIALFVLYTGVELSVGSWAYTVLTEARAVEPMSAAAWTSAYWAALTAGRLLGAALVVRVGIVPLLRISTALVAAGLAVFGFGWSLAGLVLAGTAAGPIFPSLIAVTPARVGARHAANAVGFQVAGAALGQAVVPSMLGVLADTFGFGVFLFTLAVLSTSLMLVHERVIRCVPSGDASSLVHQPVLVESGER
ncbi:MAG TPA: MFS transporter [Vicinamibacterales bacterium]|nr:MFS transporter [Vicinamibacterales bacterium]